MRARVPIHDWSALSEWADPAAAIAVREWRRLLRFGPSQSIATGTCLFDQSSTARTISLVEAGIVKLSHASSAGETIPILLRFPGDIVGVYGALLQLPHFVSATAVTDCQIGATPACLMIETVAANAEAACFLAERQTIDAARITSLLIEARTLTAKQRLFRLLLHLATATHSIDPSDSWVSAKVPLTESDIADLIAINRFAFSRLKRTLIRNGDLHQSGNFYSFRRRLARADIFN